MNNSRKAQKKFFNIIDLVIIVAVLAFVAFAANFIRNDMFSKETENVEYILRITGVDSANADKISDGYKIITSSAGTTLGTVTAVSSVSETVPVFNDASNRYVHTDVPGKSVITVTVAAKCSKVNSMYLIGDNIISANTAPDIILPFKFDSAEIISVSTQIPEVRAALNEPIQPEEASTP